MASWSGLARLGRIFMWTFLILFFLFVLNILIGKAGIAFDWEPPFLLSDVAEYLMLMATAVFFILTALVRETIVNRESAESSTNN